MSREVDERIVSLQFDNSRFERNVKTTMSTLDKLKAKLNFNSMKSFENIEAASSKVKFEGFHKAFDLLGNKTAWLETTAVTAMVNIENTALRAGKNMIESLTIKPVKMGFDEYELKMNSVQTIMSSTGESIETVNKYLDELNTYSDRTIYSFSDMTTNIGKFTNAGVKLEDAVAAMKGISNEAAISGANANEASRAMYNLAQSLSMGYVQYIDWKSIENANMATVDFKQNLANMAVAMGTVTKVGDDLYQVGDKTYNLQALFKDGMKDMWLTSEVLVEQLKQYADEETELGRRAYAAAEDIKTFSQMWDTLAESAQSGWAQTWQLIVGDLTEAKTMLKRIAAPLDSLIQNTANLRNVVIGGAFTNGFDKIKDVVEDAGLSTTEFEDKLIRKARVEGVAIDMLINEYGDLKNAISAGGIPKDVLTSVLDEMTASVANTGATFENETAKLEAFQKVVDEVWRGDWSNNYDETREREKLLTDAGYDFAAVQELVNKSQNGYRLTLEDLTSEQMRNIGFTEDQVKAVSELQLAMKNENGEVGQLIEQMSRPNARFLLLDSIRSVFESLKNVVGGIQDAFTEVFGAKTSNGIWSIINAIHSLLTALEVTKEGSDGIRKAFATMFYIVDMLTMGVTSTIQFFGKVITKVFKGTSKESKSMGNGIYELVKHMHDLSQSFHPLEQIFKKIEPILQRANNSINKFVQFIIDKKDVAVNFIAGFNKGLEDKVTSVYNVITKIFTGVLDLICKIFGIHSPSKEMYDIAVYIGEGFINGIKAISGKVLAAIKALFGAASPDSVMGSITNSLAGSGMQTKLRNSYSDAAKLLTREQTKSLKDLEASTKSVNRSKVGDRIDSLRDTMSTIFKKVSDLVKGIDVGSLMALGIMGSILKTVKSLGKTTEKVISPINTITTNLGKMFGKVTDFITEAGMTMQSARKYLKSKSFEAVAKGMLYIAGSMLIVVVAMKMLNNVSWESIFKGVVILGALALLVSALSKFSVNAANAKDALASVISSGTLDLIAGALIGITICIAALMLMFHFDTNATLAACGAVIVILAVMVGVVGAMGTLAKMTSLKDMAKVGFLFLAVSTSLAIIAASLFLLSLITPERLAKMAAIMLGCITLMGLIALVTKDSKTSIGTGVMMIGFAASMLLVALAMKMLGMVTPEELVKGLAVIIALGLVFSVMSLFAKSYTQFESTADKKLFNRKATGGGGLMFLSFAVAMLVFAAAIKLIGQFSEEEILKGVAVIAALTVCVSVMLLASRAVANQNKLTTSALFLAMAVSVGIMAVIAMILGSINKEKALQGVAAIIAICLSFSVMLLALKGIKGTSLKVLKTLTACIAILAVACLALGVMKTEHALAAASSLAIIMGAMSVLFFIVGKMKVNGGTIGVLLSMTMLLAVMAGAVVVLTKIGNPAEALKAAGSLAAIMIGIGAVVIAAGKFGPKGVKEVASAIVVLAGLTAVTAALAYIFYQLKDIDGDMMLKQSLAIVAVLGALGLVAIACGVVGKFGKAAIKGVGVIDALFGSIVLLAEGALWTAVKLMKALEPDFEIIGKMFSNLGENLKPIAECSSMMNAESLDAISAFFGTIAKLAEISIKDNAGKMATNVKEFCEVLPDIAESMVTFSTLLAEGNFNSEMVNAAAGCGQMLARLESSLPRSGGKIEEWIGKRQSMAVFNANIVAFAGAIVAFSQVITEGGGVDYEAAESAANAGLAIAKLESSLPREGGTIEEWIGKRQNMDTYLANMVKFGTAIKSFATVVCSGEGIDYETAENAANAGLAIAKLEAALPREGGRIDEWIGERQNFDSYCSNLVQFAVEIKNFAGVLARGGDLDYSVAETAANAGLAIANLEAKLPRNGGKIDEWIGKRENMATFGLNMQLFGAAVISFSDAVKGAEIDEDAVKTAAKCGELIANLETGLAKHGGVVQDIFGDTDLSSFSTDMSDFGKGIAGYAEATKDMSIDQTAVSNAVTAAEAIAGLEGVLETHDGLIQNLFGDTDLTKFSTGITNFGSAIKSFNDAVKDTTTEDLGKMSTSVTEVNKFSDALDVKKMEKISDVKTAVFTNMTDNLVAFGTSIGTFNETLKSVNTKSFDEAITSFVKLIDATANIKKNTFKGLGSFGDELGKISGEGIDKFVDVFTNSDMKADKAMKAFSEALTTNANEHKEEWQLIGNHIMNNINQGIKSKSATPVVSVGKILSDLTTTLDNRYDAFYQSGRFLVNGFAKGIDDNISVATNAATSLGKQSLNALNVSLDEHSPSKETYKTGTFAVLGLVNALNAGARNAELAATGVGEATKEGMNNAINNILSSMDEIDTTPVIAPVLDLDQVNNGVISLNRMLSSTTPELNARLNTITKSMGSQYDRNDPVVDAINKMSGPSTVTNNYIDGITYDDGSNINNAVETLINATLVGRRV